MLACAGGPCCAAAHLLCCARLGGPPSIPAPTLPGPPLVQVRAPLEKKLAEEPRLFESLAAEIAALEAELAALGGGGGGANGMA